MGGKRVRSEGATPVRGALTPCPTEPTIPSTQKETRRGAFRPGRLDVGAFRKLATLLFILAIPVALITTNLRFMVNEPRVYTYAIDQYDVVRLTGVDRD